MNDHTESIIACLWGSFLGLLMGTIVALFCMVGCTPATDGVVIDEAFVMCVCMQQQLASAEKSTVELKAGDKLSNADVVALYTLYKPAISKVWAALGGGATMRDAVTEWLNSNDVKESPAEFELPKAELKSTDITPTAEGDTGIRATPSDELASQPAIKASDPTAVETPAVSVRTTAPLILYGYPGCEACAWIKRQFDLRGIAYQYQSVKPDPTKTYPYATRDGKHLNYKNLQELLK